MTDNFKFKAEHATRAAIEELKAKFRKQMYTECWEENKEDINYLLSVGKRTYGLTPARLRNILKMTSEFAGMYNL